MKPRCIASLRRLPLGLGLLFFLAGASVDRKVGGTYVPMWAYVGS